MSETEQHEVIHVAIGGANCSIEWEWRMVQPFQHRSHLFVFVGRRWGALGFRRMPSLGARMGAERGLQIIVSVVVRAE